MKITNKEIALALENISFDFDCASEFKDTVKHYVGVEEAAIAKWNTPFETSTVSRNVYFSMEGAYFFDPYAK